MEPLPAALGIRLDAALLDRALTHRSFAYENGGLPTNERLEFLGDAVLGLVVTEALYRRHPDLPEGHLAKLRASVVNARALAGVARGLGLGDHVRLGRGEEATGGRDKSSILADTLEAVIGAVYLDLGLVEAQALLHRLFGPLMDDAALRGAGLDWKTSLQELAAERGLGVPVYDVEHTGPDHARRFTATVRVVAGGRAGPRRDGGTADADTSADAEADANANAEAANAEADAVLGTGEGGSKKEAEQQAAEAAYGSLAATPGTAPAGAR